MMAVLTSVVALAGGAFVGAGMRYLITLLFAAWLGVAFPWGTLVANLLGCLLLGVFLAYAQTTPDLSPTVRLAFSTGFCGSLTTFSTFTYETVALLENDQWQLALLNVAGSLTAGLLVMAGGLWLGRVLSERL